MLGSVFLVGAGPGAPDLLTLRGRSRLAVAEVVVYDRLVCRDLLELAPASAEKIEVGKTPGRPGFTQAQIDALLVAKAREGKIVVRLKGGDPFVFGRGSEELAACQNAGIACELVPGLSSALAAPALAGIPLTARGRARSFAVMTGHAGDGEPPLPAAAMADTQVVLMGVERLAAITHELLAQGRAAATPAALIARASWPEQQILRASLGDIAQLAAARGIEPPAVLVVGPTAAAAEPAASPAAAPAGPLAGKLIALTRPPLAARKTEALLAAAGARVVSSPLIDIRYRPAAEVAAALARQPLQSYAWLVFTSRHGVTGFFQGLMAAGADARALAGLRLAVVGPGTAETLAQQGLAADLIAQPHRAAALVNALGDQASPGERLLFAAGSRARSELTAGLAARGLTVDELVVYETHSQPPSAAFRQHLAKGVDAVVFASPSAVLAFAEAGLPDQRALLLALGPTTAEAVTTLLGRPPEVAEVHSDAGLVASLIRLLSPSSATTEPTTGARR